MVKFLSILLFLFISPILSSQFLYVVSEDDILQIIGLTTVNSARESQALKLKVML